MEKQTTVLSEPVQAAPTVPKKEQQKKIFTKNNLFCWFGVSIPLIGFLVFSGFPLIISLASMFSSMEYNAIDTMKWNNFQNFVDAFSDPRVWKSVQVTLILTCAQFVSLLLAITIAAFLSQNVKGSRVFQTLYFVPYICSTVAVTIMWSNIFGVDGALNALLGTKIDWLYNLDNPGTLTAAIFISIVWQAPGYGIVMYCSAFKAINPSLYEAASLDGANAWHKFRYITLPGISSITFFLVLAGITAGLTTFDAATVMAPLNWEGNAGPNDAGLTLMYYIYLNGVKFANMGIAAVLSWVLFLIMMVPSVFLIKKRFADLEVK